MLRCSEQWEIWYILSKQHLLLPFSDVMSISLSYRHYHLAVCGLNLVMIFKLSVFKKI